jgi:hypothetical protein
VARSIEVGRIVEVDSAFVSVRLPYAQVWTK